MKTVRVRKLDRFIKVGNRFKDGPRVLVIDIETFPILGYVWGCFKQNLSVEQIKVDWSLMSFAAKWLGHPEVYYLDNRKQLDSRDDTVQLHALHQILSNCDMVVAHNGQRFDLPKIRARMAINKHRPLPPLQVIDTLNLNRTAFGFTSQKLAYLSSEFTSFSMEEKGDHKEFPGWKLWIGCEGHNPRAWRECEVYNIGDITTLEECYLECRGWYSGGPNFGPFTKHVDGEHVCPNCGGKHLTRKGTRKTQVGIYQRFQCDTCGGWSRGRLLIANKQQRSHILMN